MGLTASSIAQSHLSKQGRVRNDRREDCQRLAVVSSSLGQEKERVFGRFLYNFLMPDSK